MDGVKDLQEDVKAPIATGIDNRTREPQGICRLQRNTNLNIPERRSVPAS